MSCPYPATESSAESLLDGYTTICPQKIGDLASWEKKKKALLTLKSIVLMEKRLYVGFILVHAALDLSNRTLPYQNEHLDFKF